jgi:hypothetical protein
LGVADLPLVPVPELVGSVALVPVPDVPDVPDVPVVDPRVPDALPVEDPELSIPFPEVAWCKASLPFRNSSRLILPSPFVSSFRKSASRFA